MTTITKDDFLKMVRHNYLEVITEDQLKKNSLRIQNLLNKSLTSELTDLEKSMGNQLINEIGSFSKWEVIRDDFSKAIVYTRKEQVEWEDANRDEFGEIIKAKSGTYKDTPENRKAGRVGMKYGEVSKEEKEDIKALREYSKKIGENIKKKEKVELTDNGENVDWDGINKMFDGEPIKEKELEKTIKGAKKLFEVWDRFGNDTVYQLTDNRVLFTDRNSGINNITKSPVKNIDSFLKDLKNKLK